jgi:hypothetical protein
VPCTPVGHQALEVLGLLGVVEYQQPPVPTGELGQDRGDLFGLLQLHGQAQPGRERGQPGRRHQRRLGRHPPDQVIVAGVPVGILQRQLALADPTQPMGGHHRRGPRGKALSQRVEHVGAAGEVGIAGGKVADRRTRARKLRRGPQAHRCRGKPRERRRRLRAARPLSLLDRGQQPRSRGRLVQVDQVDVDPGRQQAWRVAGLDPDGDQQAPLAGWVLGEGGPPLRLPERRPEIRRRQHRHRPVGPLDRLLHLVDKVAAYLEVPGLQHRRVAGRLQLPRDPLRPGPVGGGIADKQRRRSHPPPSP